MRREASAQPPEEKAKRLNLLPIAISYPLPPNSKGSAWRAKQAVRRDARRGKTCGAPATAFPEVLCAGPVTRPGLRLPGADYASQSALRAEKASLG